MEQQILFMQTIVFFRFLGLYSSADAFFIAFAVNFLVCNVSVSFGKNLY